MDYYDWVASQLGKAPTVVDWKDIPNEAVSDPNLTTHSGTMRQSWVGDKVMLTRVVVKPNSRGKPHFHPAEQVSMILRGGVRVTLNGAERIAKAGAIVHIPGNAVHMFEILDEETEILDVYTVLSSVDDLKKRYPPAA
ncbi:MAG TPA: cupin domain-containing protein [Burkholderiales bacterium]|jgi:quercetin dioxygenase-like cupin family protein|nr:cupin domain-containing protein [Burkholderiales bacterium]HYK14712.1 cupin domain-containing protein [Burkholderiales bacterium]